MTKNGKAEFIFAVKPFYDKIKKLHQRFLLQIPPSRYACHLPLGKGGKSI